MIFLPILFGLLFILTLTLKLLGGMISWWVIIIIGAFFIIPIIVLVALEILSNIKNKKVDKNE